VIRFIARRLVLSILLVAAASSAALLLTRLAPGDVTAQLGPFPTAEEVASTRAQFDLDRGPAAQLALWASRVVRLDFGDSFLYGRPVGPLVAQAAANTALLAIAALVTATVAGIGLGVFTGSRAFSSPSRLGGLLNAIVRAFSLVSISMPPLLTSLFLVFVAARTGWFPTGGMVSAQASALSWGPWLADVARHLPLPVLALALPLAATFERLQSQAIGETMNEPFVKAAQARGVPPRDLILRHAWRVSLRPILAVYGVVIGALLSGSFVVEYITAWPGLGRLMYDALRARDIYLVTGCAAMGSLFLAIGTLAGDLLMAAADPRAREAH
jgi:peptide/nickel transport system permease protein